MLSFDNGTPIAIIKGGELNGELLYIKNPNNKIKEQIQEIVIPDGRLVVMPTPNKPSRMFTAGSTGSGKSTAEGSWVKQYHIMHPENPIYLFKRDGDFDPAYLGINVIEGEKISRNLRDYEDSMMIFDDIAEIPDVNLRKETKNLLIDVLKNGRKKGISVACSNQFIMDRSNTSNQLYQCDKIIIFPGSSNHQIRNMCKTYVGLSKNQIDKLLHLPSRWVLISRNYPQYICYETGCYII